MESQLEVKVGGHLETELDAASTAVPVFNFDSPVVFSRKYEGYQFQGRNVYTLLEITRGNGILKFDCRVRYADGDSKDEPVLRVGRREANLANKPGLCFSANGLASYASRNEIEFQLPPEYARLEEEAAEIKKQRDGIYRKHGLGKEARKKLGREKNDKIDELCERMNSIYAEAALRSFGEQWIAQYNQKLKDFIEVDEPGVNLSTLARVALIPRTKEYVGRGRRLPGCFGKRY